MSQFNTTFSLLPMSGMKSNVGYEKAYSRTTMSPSHGWTIRGLLMLAILMA